MRVEKYGILTLLLAVFLAMTAGNACGQDDSLHTFRSGRSLFQTNCGPCHGVHKEMTGPMLASITKKRSKEWLHAFIKNSQSVIVSGDEYAAALFQNFNQQVMPAFQDMPDSLIAEILRYIEIESTRSGEKISAADISQVAPPHVLQGKELFSYQCANCHSVGREDYGPALGSIKKRLGESWLIPFIRNSQQVIRSGDPYAVNVFNRFDKKVMVAMEFLTREDIMVILDYIEFASASSHTVAGVNGRPRPPGADQNAVTRGGLPDPEESGSSFFKVLLIVMAGIAACIHGYLIARLFRYLNKERSHRL